MKFLDLFSGIGGFRLGMIRNGHEPVGYIENDKFARKSYEAIYDVKREWTARDVQKVEPEEIPDFDVLCAGFPCQDFSVAGDREGLEGTRGTLFYEIGRIAEVKQPDYLFLENVKGLLSHDGGRTFGIILKSLGKLGYDVEWQVLNSKNFGVPQNRERVFIVGHLGEKPRRTVFPIGGETDKSCKRVGRVEKVSGHDILKRVYSPKGISPVVDSMSGGNREPFVIDHGQPKIRNQSTMVGANYHKGLDNHGQRTGVVEPVMTPDYTQKGMNKKSQIGSEDNMMFTIDSTSQHGILEELDYVGSVSDKPWLDEDEDKSRGHHEGNRVYSDKGLSPTLAEHKGGASGHSQVITSYKEKRIRKLTPKETWRLQGFPDWAYKRARVVNSVTQLYCQAGNAVTVNVVEAIAKNLVC